MSASPEKDTIAWKPAATNKKGVESPRSFLASRKPTPPHPNASPTLPRKLSFPEYRFSVSPVRLPSGLDDFSPTRSPSASCIPSSLALPSPVLPRSPRRASILPSSASPSTFSSSSSTTMTTTTTTTSSPLPSSSSSSSSSPSYAASTARRPRFCPHPEAFPDAAQYRLRPHAHVALADQSVGYVVSSCGAAAAGLEGEEAWLAFSGGHVYIFDSLSGRLLNSLAYSTPSLSIKDMRKSFLTGRIPQPKLYVLTPVPSLGLVFSLDALGGAIFWHPLTKAAVKVSSIQIQDVQHNFTAHPLLQRTLSTGSSRGPHIRTGVFITYQKSLNNQTSSSLNNQTSSSLNNQTSSSSSSLNNQTSSSLSCNAHESLPSLDTVVSLGGAPPPEVDPLILWVADSFGRLLEYICHVTPERTPSQLIPTQRSLSSLISPTCIIQLGALALLAGLRGAIAVVRVDDMSLQHTFLAHKKCDIAKLLHLRRPGVVWSAGSDSAIEVWGASFFASLSPHPASLQAEPPLLPPLHRLCRHRGAVSDLVSCSDDAIVVSGSVDRSIVVWHAQTHQVLQEFLPDARAPYPHHTEAVQHLHMAASGALWLGSLDQSISVWHPIRAALTRLAGDPPAADALSTSPSSSALSTAPPVAATAAAARDHNQVNFSWLNIRIADHEIQRCTRTARLPVRKEVVQQNISLDLRGPVRVVKGGWMIKQGGAVKNWKKRYFLLYSDNTLKYFVDKECQKFKGVIPVHDASDIHMATVDKHTDCLCIVLPYRVYAFKHETKDEITCQWFVLLEGVRESINALKSKP